MPLKHFTHDFNPRPPDPYAKNRLFKAAEELGYVVLTEEASSVAYACVAARLSLVRDRDYSGEEDTEEAKASKEEEEGLAKALEGFGGYTDDDDD